MLVGALFRALALLATTAASVAMFVESLRGLSIEAFVKSNSLPLHDRMKLVASMLITGTLAAAAGGIYARFCGVTELRRVAHRLAPLAVLGLLPPLCTPAAWTEPLPLTLAMAAFVLLSERLLRLSFAVDGYRGASALGDLFPPAVRRWGPVTLVFAGAAGYAVYMSVQTLWMPMVAFRPTATTLGSMTTSFGARCTGTR